MTSQASFGTFADVEARPQPRSGRAAPALAAIAIAAVVLLHMVHGGWGLIWLLLPALLIARRVTCH